MSGGGALSRLLGRPATLAWVPLSGFAAVSGLVVASMAWVALDASFPGTAPIVANLALGRGSPMAVLVPMFSAMIGLLAGQAIKELQHCHFSWALPGLRRRLLPGALLMGMFVAVFGREILAGGAFLVLAALQADPFRYLSAIWGAFPPASVGLAALAFLTFWIGVHPSVVNWTGVMAPLLIAIPLLENEVVSHPVLTVLATAPLTAFLIRETFSSGSARRRPFIPTRPLTGGGMRAGSRKRTATGGIGSRSRRPRR